MMRRREMANNPAVMGALLPVEKAVFLATTEKAISEFNSSELAKELAMALKWIAKDVGYRITDEGEYQYLTLRTAEILKRYYGQMTMADFRMAFEMCITGELDDYLPKNRDGNAERNHYQQFNADYICKILNAYRARRSRILAKANAAMPEPARVDTPEDIRRRENNIRNECIYAFMHYKYCGFLPRFSPVGEMLCYQKLSDVGLADDITISADEQREILRETISGMMQRGEYESARKMREEKPQMYGSFIKARRRKLRETFDWMIREEIQITDYIKLK